MHPTGTTRSSRRSARLFGAPIVALALLGALVPGPSARAQEEGGGVSLRLVGQPVWHRPADTLDVKLLVVNESPTPLEGFRISVGVDDRRTSRSDLHSSYVALPGSEATVLPFDFPMTVEAGATELVTIEEPVASFSTLAVATEGGVYPATYRLQDASGLEDLDFVSSPVIYYPQTPETPLDLVMLVPMNDDPSLGPAGHFLEDDEGSVPLQRATSETGWITAWLDALEAAAVPAPQERDGEREGRGHRGRRRPPPPPPSRPVSLALAPTPRLLEELAQMSDGYALGSGPEVGDQSPEARGAANALGRFEDLLAEDGIEPVLVPYSFSDMPTLLDKVGLEHALAQMSTATTVVRETTGVNLNDPWFFPPAGRIDETTLQQLQDARYGAKTFFSTTSIPFSDDPVDSGCPDSSPSFTCPISVETVSGVARGFVSDRGIAERLSLLQTGTEDRVYLQQFFAETSMIHEELPNVAGRVVQATTPSLWHPTPRLARVLLTGLRDAPWIRTIGPDRAFRSESTERREIVATAQELENTPDDAYFGTIAEADQVVDSYGTMVPATSERLRRLGRNVLVAESRTWWRDPFAGESYATASSDEAQAEMERVSINVAEGTTFTSRAGAILLLVSNTATYPVKVAIRFDSPGLEFDRTAIIDTYEPGNTDLTVDARTTSSGFFELRVNLETIDGYVISTQEITIRSTSFNEIAVGLTIGALAFLVLFYVVRAVRKRRPEETTGE